VQLITICEVVKYNAQFKKVMDALRSAEIKMMI